ncbi:hypothetical protein FACS1894208_08100 [Clostridia bacterium]|nr:hypothetical protein FACS1894208_08100 [Clostridia bacterium]
MALFMCKDTPVYDIGERQVLNSALCPFTGDYYKFANEKRLYLQTNRVAASIDAMTGTTPEEKRVKSRRLSLSDCYWVKHKSDNVKFADVTPYHNPAITAANLHLGKSSPDLTVGGSETKHWVRFDGVWYLCKRLSAVKYLNELVAIHTATALRVPVNNAYCRSGAGLVRGSAVLEDQIKRCGSLERLYAAGGLPDVNELYLENIADSSRMLLNFDMLSLKVNGYNVREVTGAFRKLGFATDMSDLYALRTVLFDAIVGNYDRFTYMPNWGVYKSPDTGKYSCSPLYDFDKLHLIDLNRGQLDMVAAFLRADGYTPAAVKLLKEWKTIIPVSAVLAKCDYLLSHIDN